MIKSIIINNKIKNSTAFTSSTIITITLHFKQQFKENQSNLIH